MFTDTLDSHTEGSEFSTHRLKPSSLPKLWESEVYQATTVVQSRCQTAVPSADSPLYNYFIIRVKENLSVLWMLQLLSHQGGSESVCAMGAIIIRSLGRKRICLCYGCYSYSYHQGRRESVRAVGAIITLSLRWKRICLCYGCPHIRNETQITLGLVESREGHHRPSITNQPTNQHLMCPLKFSLCNFVSYIFTCLIS